MLRQVLVAEAGCPVMLTDVVQLAQPLKDFPHWADVAVSYEYETNLPETEFWGGRHRRQIWREPVGVVAAITAWNYPLFLHLAKLGPALAAGCTIVLKPPPDTPWSATHIGRLIAERTDIPPGVVNIVTAADPGRRRGADHRPTGRHDHVHRLRCHRTEDHGRGRADLEEDRARAGWQVRAHRARRR